MRPLKKILYVIGQLALGGAERQLFELIKRIDKSRFEISVVCLSAETEPYKIWLEKLGIEVKTLPIQADYGISRFRGLFTHMRNFKPDIVHSYLTSANLFSYPPESHSHHRLLFLQSPQICWQ